MTKEDMVDLIDILYPYFYKKQKQDDKNSARLVNATVVSVGGPGAEIKINPYDTNTIYATISEGIKQAYSPLVDGQGNSPLDGKSVKVLYSESLKDAQIIAINE